MIEKESETWPIASLDDVRTGRLPSFGADPGDGVANILLWGDSHSLCVTPAFDLACKQENVTGYLAYHFASPPLINTFFKRDWGLNEQGPAFAEAVLGFVAIHHIKNVVLSAYWSSYQLEGEEPLKNALAATIERLHNMGCKIWVLEDIPNVDMNVPLFLARRHTEALRSDGWHRTVAQHRAQNSVIYTLDQSNLPATFIDLAPPFLDADGISYRCFDKEVSLYRDSHHLKPIAAIKYLTPLIQKDLVSKVKCCLSHE